MALHIVSHPLIQHKLGLMRDARLSTKSFRELANEVSALLTYEATSDFELEPTTIPSWDNRTITVQQLRGKKVTVVPILRAGLGMLDGVVDLIPAAKISVVGLYRDESTLEPVTYFEKLASDMPQRTALVIDPMLATGGTMIATLDMLKAKGCKDIRVLVLVAAPEGVAKVTEAHPDVALYTAALDERLNEDGYIVPGLGDAGDRIFGTR